MLTVREVTEAEVEPLVDQAWAATLAGQKTFGLDAQLSRDALLDAWLRLCTLYLDDHVLVVEDGGIVVGAAAVVVDDTGLSMRNGPFTFHDDPAVFDAGLAWLRERHAGKSLSFGVDPANALLHGWLAGRSEVMDTAIVTQATFGQSSADAAPPDAGAHLVALDEADDLRRVLAPLEGTMDWDAPAVLADWENWLVDADDAWRGCIPVRVYDAELCEGFAVRAPEENEALISVMASRMVHEVRARALGACTWFVAPSAAAELAAALACGFERVGDYERRILTL